jgi:serine/threonine protein phosphatase PrpC
VISTPECSTIELGPNDCTIILATDGLTDGLTAKEILQVAKSNSNPKECAQCLMKAAVEGLNKNQVDDNVSAIVVSIRGFQSH